MSSIMEQGHPEPEIVPKRMPLENIKDLRPAAVYPKKQVPGIALIFGMAAFCIWGLYRVAKANQKRDAAKNELEIARINILPLLQAESDRRFIRQRKQQIEEEEKIMAGVEGWVVGESVYKTRWMPPTGKPPAYRL